MKRGPMTNSEAADRVLAYIAAIEIACLLFLIAADSKRGRTSLPSSETAYHE